MLSGCPFCHHCQSSLYREKQQLRDGGFCNILSCNECHLLYPQMRMDEKEKKQYMKADVLYSPDSLLFHDPRVELSADFFAVTFLNDVEKQGRSLDIGTWSGTYTHIFKALGYDSYGLELQKQAVDFARSKGLQVLPGSFPDRIPQKLLRHKFRLIAMMEMIYYLHDLKKSLLKVKTMLEDNGVLVIKAHQGSSKFYDCNQSCFNRYGDYVQGIPTLRSLQYCLEKSGFKVIKFTGATEDNLAWTGTIESADRLWMLAGKA
ncbi:MAG TPA: methyltransferase domain-containing protein [Nitrospirales bacterium]|jgi:SAM-dependent methyltransferase